MSLEQQSIRIAIGDNLWTRALVDGSVRVDGFAVEFHSKVTLPDRLHGVQCGPALIEFARGGCPARRTTLAGAEVGRDPRSGARP